MKNAKKYITLYNREVKQTENAEKYEAGIYYNLEKSDNWHTKAAKTNAEMEKLEAELTEEEKEFVEDQLGWEVF